MNAVSFIRPHPVAAVTFRAWSVGESGQAWPLDIGAPADLQGALNEAQLGTGLNHKNKLLIHERDEARGTGTLHTYAVVKKAAIWRKNDETGVPERFEPLALKPDFTVSIPRFDPEPPFDALADYRNIGAHERAGGEHG